MQGIAGPDNITTRKKQQNTTVCIYYGIQLRLTFCMYEQSSNGGASGNGVLKDVPQSWHKQNLMFVSSLRSCRTSLHSPGKCSWRQSWIIHEIIEFYLEWQLSVAEIKGLRAKCRVAYNKRNNDSTRWMDYERVVNFVTSAEPAVVKLLMKLHYTFIWHLGVPFTNVDWFFFYPSTDK